MKRILLTSTALVGLAGAAMADSNNGVSWSGSATLGYNDDIKDGIYADVDLDVTLSQTLDNGITVSVTFGWELEDHRGPANAGGNTFMADNNVTVKVMSDVASLYYGDVEFAPVDYFNGVTNMAEDAFSEQDGEVVLRADVMVGGFSAGLSYGVEWMNPRGNELRQLGVGGVYDAGTFSVGFAYQEEEAVYPTHAGDFNHNEVLGLFATANFAGADVKVAWAEQTVVGAAAGESSLGIEVAYPIGPVTATVFYVAEDGAQGDDPTASGSYGIMVDYDNGPLSVSAFLHDGQDQDSGVNVAYDLGTGLVIYAGWSDDDGQYIGGEYALSDMASLTISYAEDEDNAANDEIGPQKYLHGITLAAAFDF